MLLTMLYVSTGKDMEYLEKMLSVTPVTMMNLGRMKNRRWDK